MFKYSRVYFFHFLYTVGGVGWDLVGNQDVVAEWSEKRCKFK